MKNLFFVFATCVLLTLTSCWFAAGVIIGSVLGYTPVEGDQIFYTTTKDTTEYFLIKKNTPDTLKITSLKVDYIEKK